MNDMDAIESLWGTNLRAAVAASSVPEALLAAIVGNESSGNPGAQRFESGVFFRLAKVIRGSQATFAPAGCRAPLKRNDILAYCAPGELLPSELSTSYQGPPFAPLPPGAAPHALGWALGRLQELATSYGLTQIMAWHLVEMAGFAGWGWTVGDLALPQANLRCAVALLTYFAERYNLDLATDAEQLLRCWNTGEPDGQTYDPQYVGNGLARMAAYRGAAATPAPPASPSV
jgi:Transglycosylase SLT domain